MNTCKIYIYISKSHENIHEMSYIKEHYHAWMILLLLGGDLKKKNYIELTQQVLVRVVTSFSPI